MRWSVSINRNAVALRSNQYLLLQSCSHSAKSYLFQYLLICLINITILKKIFHGFMNVLHHFYGLGDKTSLRRYVTAQMLYERVSCWYLCFDGSLRTAFQIDADAQSHHEWSGACFRAWELTTSVSHLLYYTSMKLQPFNLSLCILFSLGTQSPRSCSQTSFPIQWAVLEVLQAPEACWWTRLTFIWDYFSIVPQ